MLLKHASFLTQAWNKLLSVTEVIELLKVEDAEWKAASNASARGAEEGSHSPDASRSAVTLRGVTEAALKRALLEDPRFVALAEEIADLDLDTNEGRASALETALLSGLTIIQRFFANPTCLTTKHVAFASLTLCLSELPSYFGRAQATDLVTGEIPELRDSWLFDAKQAENLFKGKISEVTWFNLPHGALGLMNLDASEPFRDCPIDQLYTVESVLEETIPFVRATMLAAGWAAESKAGYTLLALFERQLAHVRWIRKQGEMEISTLLPHAQESFQAALLACDETHGRMLSHPEPMVAKLDFHLPFDGPYDKALSSKTAGGKMMITMRRAFPNLLPPSAPRSLKDLVSWPDATHMRLGSLIYDTTAIAKHYTLSLDHCFPVLLSVKKGGHALALCDHWGEAGHTSLVSEKHVAPKEWNFQYVCAHMAAKAAGAAEGSSHKHKRQKKK